MSKALFSATDPTYGDELWVTDGTSAGTHMVADIDPGAPGGSPSDLTYYDGWGYFTAYDSSGNAHLWRSDGVTAQAVTTGTFGSYVADLTVANGYLFFQGSTYVGATYTDGVFRTDGTNTIFLQADNVFGGMYATGNRVYWQSLSGGVYSSDGTTAGTSLVLAAPDTSKTYLGYEPQLFTPAGNLMFFLAEDAAGANALWVSNGTAAGTRIVVDSGYVSSFVGVGSLCFYEDAGLWVTNGTTTTKLSAAYISDIYQLTNLNGKLYFTGLDTNAGKEGLYVSDGTTGGTKLVTYVAGFAAPVAVGSTIYFYGSNPTTSVLGLWKSNGTAAGTTYVTDLAGSPNSYNAPIAVGNKIFFVANTAANGYELWVSDGTAAGTGMLKDIAPGTASSNPYTVTNFYGRALFGATGPDGTEPWISDGTTAGTVELKDIYPGAANGYVNGSNPADFLVLPDPTAPTLTLAAKPTVTGTGATVTINGGYSSAAALQSVAISNGATVLGYATINATSHSWSFTTTLAAGNYTSFQVTAIDANGGTATVSLAYALQIGVTGQFYVTVETDIVASVTVSKTYYRPDASIYEFDSYSSGVLASQSYYNLTGYDFTSYEIDYDASSHLTRKQYNGYTNQSYVVAIYDYSYNSVTTNYTLLDAKFLDSTGAYVEKLVYATDGSYSDTYYQVTGQSYTSYEIDYASSGYYTAYKYYGYQGLSYTTVVKDFSWSSTTGVYTLIDVLYLNSAGQTIEKIGYNADKSYNLTYYNITGQAYTSYEVEYDKTSHYTALKYLGFSGRAYVELEYDYSYSAATYTLNQLLYTNSGGTLIESIVYKAGGSRVESHFHLTGLAYTSYEIDYDASGHYTAYKYSGFSGQSYSWLERDYSWSAGQYTLVDALYYNSSNTLVEKIVYNVDGSYFVTVYGVTGQSYTAYEVDYDKSGHYTAYKYLGFSGQSYSWLERDYSWSAGKYTLVDSLYYNSSNALVEKIVYNADGSYVETFYGLTGRSYTSYEVDYDKSAHYTALKYTGFSGLAYVSEEDDYSWSASLYTKTQSLYYASGGALYEKIVYLSGGAKSVSFYGLTGQTYTSYEVDYAASGHYTAIKFFGYAGQFYASRQLDYSWSSTSQYTLLDTLYFDANHVLLQKNVSFADGSYDVTYYGVTGQAYTSDEVDYDKTGHYNAKFYYGYTGQSYVSEEDLYSWSSTSAYTLTESLYSNATGGLVEKVVYNSDASYAATYYGVTGQSYTSYEKDYNSSGRLTREAYFTSNGQPSEIDTFYADGSTAVDIYQVQSATVLSYETVRDANGVELSQRTDYRDGTHEIDAEQSGVTVNATTGPDTIFINGSVQSSGGWGVTVNFPQLFAQDIVRDFFSRATASDASHLADTLVLPATEFADFHTFYVDSVYSPTVGGTVTTASNGDSLTMFGMTMTSLQAAQPDFKFV